ncbi:MAG: hypothetical protein JO026_03320, partial [Patescibacteria group bacterium]|nr:hypothetical protein [Patescibacteria group bacterium]
MYWLPEFLSHPYTALRSEDEPTRPSSEKPRDERLPTPKNSEEMRALLQRLGRRRFFGLQLPREALRRDAFIDALIGMAESSLAPFAANPNTFPANDFRLAALVSNERADY